MTEVLDIDDFLVKSTLYTSSESSMADDYQTLSSLSALPALFAGVGLVFFQQVASQPSVSRLCKHHLPRHRCVINCCHRYLILLFSYYFNGYSDSWRKVFVYIRCSLMLSALNSASYGIHGTHLTIHAMLIMHKQCVHLQAHRVVINHRVVLILPVQLFTDQPLDYHHQ